MEDPCPGEANLAVTSSRRASRLRRSGGPARFRAACSRPASLHFLAGLLASGAGAQKAATPVSNTGQQQTTGASRVVETQSFTTGTHGTGYTLSSVWLRPFLDFTGDTATLVSIKTDSGGRPAGHADRRPRDSRRRPRARELLRLHDASDTTGYGSVTAADVAVTVADDDTASDVTGQATGLTAEATVSRVVLNWTAPSGTVFGYRIEASHDGGSSWAEVMANTYGTGTACTHVSGLRADETRHYRVSAIFGDGAGPVSDAAEANAPGRGAFGRHGHASRSAQPGGACGRRQRRPVGEPQFQAALRQRLSGLRRPLHLDAGIRRRDVRRPTGTRPGLAPGPGETRSVQARFLPGRRRTAKR
ncbi:MAG: fibronectin type III domain-containing protein [Boseongicola sp. SB0677_bin_26]|nr:fibronectin type III domain-containing protein [Boseongicola sp. SB0665_bin_10]MYG27529.1 fibronectin type III domain-containing protein [Boseongicola sp. SB0677_bin_26]